MLLTRSKTSSALNKHNDLLRTTTTQEEEEPVECSGPSSSETIESSHLEAMDTTRKIYEKVMAEVRKCHTRMKVNDSQRDVMEERLGTVFISMQDSKAGKENVELCIDAGTIRNVTRYINHSCQPNLFVQCVFSAHHDITRARLILFAADNIQSLKAIDDHLHLSMVSCKEWLQKGALVEHCFTGATPVLEAVMFECIPKIRPRTSSTVSPQIQKYASQRKYVRDVLRALKSTHNAHIVLPRAAAWRWTILQIL
nr:histone-lysine N-methyltransferase, H3 lysine-9 specific SUVH4 [Tanacetum cinerariifolium]